MNELLGSTLAKTVFMGGLYPRGIYGPIKADHGIHTAVRADCRLILIIAVTPFGNKAGRVLAEAVVANCHLAGKEPRAMHGRFTGPSHMP
ncbi:MAG: hypothetical protein ACN6O2_08795 [Stenotrophomonas sp.]